MKKFAETITDLEIMQTVSAQLSWSHNATLLDKLKNIELIEWYAKMAIKMVGH